jgi:hypothetical protein
MAGDRRSKQKKKEYVSHLREIEPCAVCGEMDPMVKEFHHLDPAEKLFNIGNSWQTRSMVQIVAEVAKCVILCANCHKRVQMGVIELPGEQR